MVEGKGELMAQEQVNKNTEKSETPPSGGDAKGLSPDSQAKVDKATENIDDILDDIDGLLENNSEEFVNSFVQKGGQ